MNKTLPIILSLLLLTIIGGLVYYTISINSKSQMSNSKQIEITNNNQEKINMTETQIVKLKTNQGEIKLELFTGLVPKTVENFVTLANQGFYDGTRFHRVIKDFMIQGGDPLSKDESQKIYWGTGGPGYQFDDEFAEGLTNVVGTISMANAGANTNGSQFFINTNDNVFLDGKHSVFGKVIEGMDIVLEIQNIETDPTNKPLKDIIIESIELL